MASHSARISRAFTLIELLVVIAIIAILAAILFPVFAQAKESAKRSTCLSNMRQVGISIFLYMGDADDRLPDRRDLKASLPGGYRPWTTWPPSDPRSGWADVILKPYTASHEIYSCPSILGGPMRDAIQVRQESGDGHATHYWMWRFDRGGETVEQDNFWGKTVDAATADFGAAKGTEFSITEIELLTDPYFPRTARNVDPALAGINAHRGGLNRLYLDSHAKYVRDIRLKQ